MGEIVRERMDEVLGDFAKVVVARPIDENVRTIVAVGIVEEIIVGHLIEEVEVGR